MTSDRIRHCLPLIFLFFLIEGSKTSLPFLSSHLYPINLPQTFLYVYSMFTMVDFSSQELSLLSMTSDLQIFSLSTGYFCEIYIYIFFLLLIFSMNNFPQSQGLSFYIFSNSIILLYTFQFIHWAVFGFEKLPAMHTFWMVATQLSGGEKEPNGDCCVYCNIFLPILQVILFYHHLAYFCSVFFSEDFIQAAINLQ